MRPMIEVVSLHKSYGSHRALAGLDLDVAAGTILGLLGHNGAGKTVSKLWLSLRAVAGRDPTACGRRRRGA